MSNRYESVVVGSGVEGIKPGVYKRWIYQNRVVVKGGVNRTSVSISNVKVEVEEYGDHWIVVGKPIRKPVYMTPIQRVALVRESGLETYAKVSGAADAEKVFSDYFKKMQFAQEVVVIATLDTKNKITGIVEITRGTLDASLVHPREVFAPAIVAKASSILVAHNHPSGDPTPSREDIKVTDRLQDAGTILGIDVLDHIVVGDHTWKAVSIRSVA